MFFTDLTHLAVIAGVMLLRWIHGVQSREGRVDRAEGEENLGTKLNRVEEKVIDNGETLHSVKETAEGNAETGRRVVELLEELVAKTAVVDNRSEYCIFTSLRCTLTIFHRDNQRWHLQHVHCAS